MISPPRFLPAAMLLAALTALGSLPAEAAVRKYSVEEFNKARPGAGVEVSVEGHLQLLARDSIRLKSCDVNFQLVDARSNVPRGAKFLELTGRILPEAEAGGSRNVFQVTSVRGVPSDLEKFLAKRRLVRIDDADGLQELASWAEQRGKFYKDSELLGLAAETRARVIEVVHRQAAREGPDALLALAERAEALRLPEATRLSLVHEAYHQLWRASRAEPEERLDPLLTRMARDLPGSTEPLKEESAELRKQYAEHPLETYEAADEAVRRSIHRLIYADIRLRTITGGLAADGGNGAQIADLIDAQVPEEHALAETLRDKQLALRAAGVEKLPRREMLALAEEFVARKLPREGDRIKAQWLTARRLRLQPDDIEGLLRLADDYRTLLNDTPSADLLLIEAYKRNPGAVEVIEQLERLGYQLKKGVWLSRDEYRAHPQGKLEQALREGRVESGMTAAQVRKGLGEPSTLSRSITAKEVSETWIYGGDGTARIAVRFSRRRGLPDLKVVTVAPLDAVPPAGD